MEERKGDMMRKSRRLAGAIATVGVLLAVAACGSSSSNQSSSPAAAAGASSSSNAAKGKNITFVTALLADANWHGLNACFTKQAKAYGMNPTLVAPPNETASNPGMVSLAQQALTTHPDGLIVVPLIPGAFTDVLKQAKADHVPVVTLAANPTDPSLRTAEVYTNTTTYGLVAAKEVAKLTGGHGNIGILYSGPTVTTQLQQMAVFKKYMAQHEPGLKIVDPGEIIEPGGNRNEAQATEIARGMLVAHPNINVIWSPDGLGGIVGALAARELHKKPGQITIVGADHLPQVAADLKSGWEQASVQLVSCTWGDLLAKTFYEYFNHKLTQTTINVPPHVFDRANP